MSSDLTHDSSVGTLLGDGVHTTRELIDLDNMTNPRCGQLPYEKSMNLIDPEAVRAF